MLKKLFAKNKGQTLVIFALAIAGLIAVAALIIDGGGMYVNRRQAQTAADSAAMAGAYELCVNKGTVNSITNVVNNYALAQNQATSVDSVSVDFNNHAVSVDTTVSSQSFFAVILGQENNVASAQASAGCFSPATYRNVLPIAWTCRPHVGGSILDKCQVHAIPWNIFKTLQTYFSFDTKVLNDGDGSTHESYSDESSTKGKLIYLVMDDGNFDPYVDCKELTDGIGSITCDFNNDGILDVEGGADRGWLLLDGTGASDLTDVMLNGFPKPITPPHWFPGKSGVSNSVFINAHTIKNNIVLIPIFNAICPNTTTTGLPTSCPTEYLSGDKITGSSGQSNFYRIVGFAPFVVTCVSKGASEYCPGKDLANLKHNVSSIEGYFISGYIAGENLTPGGNDLGVYIISLTE